MLPSRITGSKWRPFSAYGFILSAALSFLTVFSGCDQFVPENYTTSVKTKGKIEAKYLASGDYSVDRLEFDAPEPAKHIAVYFPNKLRTSQSKYPVVIFVNGTGVTGSKYQSLFRHLASWGFVAVGNEDPSTGLGVSASQTLDFILRENKRKESVFYGKIDEDNIGVTGHSQGGAGVFNAVTKFENSKYFKTAVSLSPTNETLADKIHIGYDSSKINIPILILAGDGDAFETKLVIPIEELKKTYGRITAPKAAARRKGAGHGQMLYSADGYVTAWFMAQLQGDEYAAKAFEGASPELLDNPLYRDQTIDIQ